MQLVVLGRERVEHASQLGCIARHAGASGLGVTDPDLAASHYLSLTVGEVLQRGHLATGDTIIDGLIRAGVRVFLHGYNAVSADGTT